MSKDKFLKGATRQLTTWAHVRDEALHIPIDKIRLCLMEHEASRRRADDWLAPLGIFVALLIALLAADFKKFVFEPSVWQAVFVLAAIVCFLWSVLAISNCIRHRPKTIEELVETLKQGAQCIYDGEAIPKAGVGAKPAIGEPDGMVTP